MAVETVCSGTGAQRVCATIDRKAGRTVVRAHAGTWGFAAAPPALAMRSDGELIAEEYRPGGLIEPRDPLGTVLVVLRRRTGIVRRLTIGDIARTTADLPRTASHRNWSDVRYFGADGTYVVELTDGRRLTVGRDGKLRFTRTR